MYSCVFQKRSHSIYFFSQMEIILFENHARTETIVCRRAILHIAGRALCARLPTNFKPGLDAFFKWTTVRHTPITSCVSAIYAMHFIVVAYITTPIIYFDFFVRRPSQNVSRIRLVFWTLYFRMKFSYVYCTHSWPNMYTTARAKPVPR